MSAFRNQRLFSDHYLQEILPQSDEWKSIDKEKSNEAFTVIQSLYQKKCKIIPSLKESQLEEEFIRPILRILGHIYALHPSIDKIWEGAREPDYAFYPSEEAKREASIRKAIAIGEAKRYGRPLGKKLKSGDSSEIQNPSLQMSRYLWLSEVRWGILTDGRFWRLYERETSKRIDIFYEIDLERLLEKGNIEDFKYFYLFFRKEAFPEFLQGVYSESLDYAEKVGEELKENVYQALKFLAEGFLKTPENNLTPENLKEIHDNSLVLLYRLLFTLYAEYRRLLPLEENELYTDSYSLDCIKKEIRDKIDRNSPLSRAHAHYWDKLKELFGTINSGDPEMGVPFYNGGLFEPQKHPFLEKYRVADFYVAKAVDLLCRSKDKAFIDYSSLEARHLGSIYEGLLEYKVKIAQEDLVATKKKGKEIFVSLREAKASGNKIRESEIIESRELYLATDKGERKASGSYYTPEYIVKYIVENTLGPVIEEKKKLIEGKMQELQKKFKISRGYNREAFEKQLRQSGSKLIDEILKIKVLDPAMGSGHFLVEATDFLAHALVEALNSEIVFESSTQGWFLRDEATSDRDEDDIRWARREVVERCIYGVDLNPLAVELAKLSLWLSTVAKGKPLNFLDHHLKCGNSLIGARVDDLANPPELKKKKKREEIATLQGVLFDVSSMTIDLGLAVGDYFLIEDKLSDSLKDIKDKEKIYQNLNRQRIDKWRAVGDLWTSSYFGVNLDSALYKALSDYLLGKSKRIPQEWVKDFVDKASKIAKEKRFFHWELEFPEVFFDRQGKKLDNPGFDVVVGNPPWGGRLSKIQKQYFKQVYESGKGAIDTFALFTEKKIHLTSCFRMVGAVLPDIILLKDYPQIRKFILENCHITNAVHWGRAFSEANIDTCTLILKKQQDVSYKNMVNVIRDIINWEKENYTKSFIPQRVFKENAGYKFNLYLTDLTLCLISKLDCPSVKLTTIAHSHEGIHSGNIRSKLFLYHCLDDSCFPLLFGGSELRRYELVWEGRFIHYDERIILREKGEYANLARKEYFIEPKLLIQRTGDRVIASYDSTGFYASNNFFTCQFKDKYRHYNLEYLLAFLNSPIATWYFRSIQPRTGRLYAELKIIHLKQLPIRRICFTTPEEERKKLVEEGKKLYENCLENGNWDPFLFFASQRLEKQYIPDPELVKKHNVDPLNKDFQIREGELIEQSDVIHDLLAFLAEKMIEYNKEKNKETKSFLGWLEREAGTKVEDLTGKTTIKKYHETTADNLISILKKNKKKLHIDPSRRDFQDRLSAEFDKSLQKLTPLRRKIEMTDRLIDQIVYRLYGLTEEEIGIVEESFRK
ncbi:MAG TPA: hypothetical protein ENH85_07245 [Candidatus Scalindua sp.]|nr:hypothetical protein [Candidatus Scalindua sp.]